MLSIDWRSPAAYKFAKSIPAAGFAWEYLRRDDEYRREYRAITTARDPGPERLDAFVQRWGLRFPDRPRYSLRSAVALLDAEPPAAGDHALPRGAW